MLPNAIQSRTDFIEFVQGLRRDLVTNRAQWESPDLDSFLEAMAGYAEDVDKEPSWGFFATLLWAGSRYE